MSKNLWQKDRQNLFRELVRQYSEEGYTRRSLKSLPSKRLMKSWLTRKTLLETYGEKLLMKSEWEVILDRNTEKISVGKFKTKREAEEQVEYRYTLCRHLGYDPDLTYRIRKSKPNKQQEI